MIVVREGMFQRSGLVVQIRLKLQRWVGLKLHRRAQIEVWDLLEPCLLLFRLQRYEAPFPGGALRVLKHEMGQVKKAAMRRRRTSAAVIPSTGMLWRRLKSRMAAQKDSTGNFLGASIACNIAGSAS